MPWRAGGDGVLLTVRLTPNGGRDRIEGVDELADGQRVLRVRVAAPPEKGAANEALRRLLAKRLAVPRGAVALIGGQTHRVKRLDIAGEANALMARLQELTATEAGGGGKSA